MGFYKGLDGFRMAPQGPPACPGAKSGSLEGYSGLPTNDKGTHEYGTTDRNNVYEETKGCADHLSELGNGHLCGPQPRVLSQMNGEARQNEPLTNGCEQSENVKELTTAASLASNEHLPTNLFLHHVRYEIGEHPLADIVTLTGGGGIAVPVLVGTLVPGSKAEQAGVASGDELVAVSGRPDFQKMPAERLLESLPTPTLLVFAKDPNRSLREEAQRSGAIQAAKRADNFSDKLLTAGLDAGLHASLDDSDRGFEGASWEVGVNAEPAMASLASTGLEQPTWRQTISAKKWAGLTRYNSEPTQQTPEADKTPKPSQLALIRDDIIAGLPSDHSLIGPNVELCDQVVFNPKAALWMQGGVQEGNPSSPSSQITTASINAEDDPDGSASKLNMSKGKPESGNTWMYELPRQEARRIVAVARRAASRADRCGSREEGTDLMSELTGQSTNGTVIDLDTLAGNREAKSIFPDADGKETNRMGMTFTSETTAQPRRLGTPPDTPDIEPRAVRTGAGSNGWTWDEAGVASREISRCDTEKSRGSNGPRLGKKDNRAPWRVNPDVDEFVAPEDDASEALEDASLENGKNGQWDVEILL